MCHLCEDRSYDGQRRSAPVAGSGSGKGGNAGPVQAQPAGAGPEAKAK